MTLEQIFAAGDRVEFKRYLADCDVEQAKTAWIKAARLDIQDFRQLAFGAMVEKIKEMK